jgi:hypothetical protein
MFPSRPSRAATALLELAEAILAPETFERPLADAPEPATPPDREPRAPHRRQAAIERQRRPAPPKREQTCVAPLTRAAHARDALPT